MNETFHSLETLLAVSVIAAAAPLIVAAVRRPRIPQVVILIFCGIAIGPQGLGLSTAGSISLLSNVGLGFLFLLAGYELDPSLLRQNPGKLAMIGWVCSAVIAVAAVAGLTSAGYVRDFVPIGLALTTTALGTLLPILRDNEMMSGRFGDYVLAAGAVGELFPIVAISLFLTKRNEFVAIASLLVVAVAAIGLTTVPRLVGEARMLRIVKEGHRATAQTTLRWSVVLLLVLLVLAERFGLDVVLGAMLAGMVLRRWTHRMEFDLTSLEDKLDTVGYGFFIPIFFVASGMNLDVMAIIKNPLRLLTFLVLLLVVRGLPSLVVYRRALPVRQRIEMTFITATTMPLLIALAEVGLQDGVMIPANAAALVGAGVLSVLIYPAVAVGVARKGPAAGDEPGGLPQEAPPRAGPQEATPRAGPLEAPAGPQPAPGPGPQGPQSGGNGARTGRHWLHRH